MDFRRPKQVAGPKGHIRRFRQTFDGVGVAQGHPVVAGIIFIGVGGSKVVTAVLCLYDVGVRPIEDKGIFILGLLHSTGDGVTAGLGEVNSFQVPLDAELLGGAVGVGSGDALRHLRNHPGRGMDFRDFLHAVIGGVA